MGRVKGYNAARRTKAPERQQAQTGGDDETWAEGSRREEGDKDGKVHWRGTRRTRLRAGRAQRMRKRATAGLLQGGSFRRRSNIALVGLWGRYSLETGSPLAGPPALSFMRNIQLRQSRQAHGPKAPSTALLDAQRANIEVRTRPWMRPRKGGRGQHEEWTSRRRSDELDSTAVHRTSFELEQRGFCSANGRCAVPYLYSRSRHRSAQ